MLRYALLLLMCLPASAFAQEPKTDPFELAHPVTGESGVWIPQWLQRAELERRQDLRTCTEMQHLSAKVLEAKLLEVTSLRSEQHEVQAANSRLKVQLATETTYRKKAESAANTHKTVAWASAGGGGVAILVAILLSVL